MPKVLVILDGIGDLPCKSLDGKTPLDAANTPNLDALAKQSNFGIVTTVDETIAPESDVAVTALLGYDPFKLYPGRGPLEAYGAHVQFKPGDLILRTNFATINDQKHILDRRAGRSLTTEQAQALAASINKSVRLDVPFSFIPTVEHRGLVLFRGDFSSNITNVDPAYIKEGNFGVVDPNSGDQLLECHPLDQDSKSKKSARIVNEFVQQAIRVLREHPVNQARIKKKLLPANIVLPRDAGTRLPTFSPQREGWAAVVNMPLETGIAKLAGMQILPFIQAPMKSKDPYKHLYANLKLTLKASKTALQEGKFPAYYIHIKETDIPGHDNNPEEKKEMIELVDKELFKILRKMEHLELIVTGDHSTPCALQRHSNDPVPLLWLGQEKKIDDVQRFTEKEAREGFLGKLSGKDILQKTGFI
ncbi:2,3-bisphosphoglycerate-independent phosphoglycerate mutase [Candidatus Woesearchaeota archaeon]|nr:2,3-bisphosphoglycerate-independent phosphoglycerate mutase [Candidatus Woesearchaeota archaeon]